MPTTTAELKKTWTIATHISFHVVAVLGLLFHMHRMTSAAGCEGGCCAIHEHKRDDCVCVHGYLPKDLTRYFLLIQHVVQTLSEKERERRERRIPKICSTWKWKRSRLLFVCSFESKIKFSVSFSGDKQRSIPSHPVTSFCSFSTRNRSQWFGNTFALNGTPNSLSWWIRRPSPEIYFLISVSVSPSCILWRNERQLARYNRFT